MTVNERLCVLEETELGGSVFRASFTDQCTDYGVVGNSPHFFTMRNIPISITHARKNHSVLGMVTPALEAGRFEVF